MVPLKQKNGSVSFKIIKSKKSSFIHAVDFLITRAFKKNFSFSKNEMGIYNFNVQQICLS